MEKQVKSMNDRATESIRLCKQILDLGILNVDPSYLEIQDHMNVWIKSDEKKIYEHTIYFSNLRRKATLTLPWRADRTCEFFMKAV